MSLANRIVGAFPQPAGPPTHVVQTFEGRLTCSEHPNEFACIHIGRVVREAWDANSEPGKPEPLPDTFSVVVWPKPLLEVWVGHDTESGAIWILPDSDPGRTHLTGIIGFIEPGEGRKVVRAMIVEWIAAEASHPPACTSKFHWAQEYESPADAKRASDPYDPKTQTNLFHIYTQGICSTCANDNGVPEL